MGSLSRFLSHLWPSPHARVLGNARTANTCVPVLRHGAAEKNIQRCMLVLNEHRSLKGQKREEDSVLLLPSPSIGIKKRAHPFRAAH
eukprot:UN5083